MSLYWKSSYDVFIHFQVLHILLYTYSLDETKNVQNLTKSQHWIKKLVIFSLSVFLSLYRFKTFIASISSI